MTQSDIHHPIQPPPHGQVGYLQLPAQEVARSASFYQAVFGWSADLEYGSFETPGIIGQWTTDLKPAGPAGPVLWICADDLWPTLDKVVENGGIVRGRPQLDNGERWLVEVDDPAGNRIGIVTPARTARSQTMIAVRDVAAASRWYQEVLGLRSGHGGAEYERLLADGELVLQLHDIGTEHHHGPVADTGVPVGNGVLLWFGDMSDFDGVITRAERLKTTVVRPPHRNPPDGQGNGPGHREIWLRDPDGYTVVVASPDGEAYESPAVL